MVLFPNFSENCTVIETSQFYTHNADSEHKGWSTDDCDTIRAKTNNRINIFVHTDNNIWTMFMSVMLVYVMCSVQTTSNHNASTRLFQEGKITDFDTLLVSFMERIISLHLVEHCLSMHGTCYLIKGIFSMWLNKYWKKKHWECLQGMNKSISSQCVHICIRFVVYLSLVIACGGSC